MKFSIVKEKFLEPLADISGIVARKTTKPILSHTLIQAQRHRYRSNVTNPLA